MDQHHRKHLKSYLNTHKNRSDPSQAQSSSPSAINKQKSSLSRHDIKTKSVPSVLQERTKPTNKVSYRKPNRKLLIHDIPDELLLKIFGYFDAHHLIIASQVCSRWHWVANDNHLWRPIFLKYAGKSSQGPVRETDVTTSQLKTVCMKRCVEQRNKRIFSNKNLRKKNPYTGVCSAKETEKALVAAEVSWQLVFVDSSGNERCLISHDVTWHLMSVSLRWFSLEVIPLKEVKCLRLYSCNPVFFDVDKGKSVANGPYQRSLLMSMDIRWRSWLEKNKPIGGDDIINMYSLPHGLMVSTWKADGGLAFISVGLHLHNLVNRCLKGTSTEQYSIQDRPTPTDDVESAYGLLGYTCTVHLRTMKQTIWDQQFRNLDCKREMIMSSYAHFSLIQPHERHIMDKDITFPWKTDAFKGKAKDVCWVDITVTDERGDVFWMISSPVCARTSSHKAISADFEYCGDVSRFLEYIDESGKFQMEISQTDEEDRYITHANISISLGAINRRFGTKYR